MSLKISTPGRRARARHTVLLLSLMAALLWSPLAAVAQQPQPSAPSPQVAHILAPPQQESPAQQGQRYGEDGFVGEPVNINVVKADIRDILTYITEQYGINFVVDQSVKDVPVTINVNDVPWNFALEAILRANGLGVEKTGSILRVATIDVIAKESELQGRVRDARLGNAPLITEFIRLNYARAVGTLAGAAGSSGSFSGGVQSGGSGAAGADSGGLGGGDQGILPIISRRLSKRGSVEVDGRSNTLIITDVPENIAAIRQLVALLDQPEPQVEIEMRIVIANRNFSRDLGAQLSAVVVGSRGSLGSFTTLPPSSGSGTGDNSTPGSFTNSGPVARGVPGGLAGTSQPTNSLAATAANTILGLTTGSLGTAQISFLLTAAESKGQAKIIASPRVTAMNNRPAQIESGTQIPVVTPQSGGSTGGATVFTTTFVSVPLRLSITPQITDAGTVLMRIVAENNSVNLSLTNSLGTPGIDTQRMQSEVLVPDGGTTVIGGVLGDIESETQNRTPGLSNIPVLGNLFKRKAVTRSSNEILFFITPRIYRPDYQGRPTTGTLNPTGTRMTTVPQPVPLGNPPSNTPAPIQLEQQQRQQSAPIIIAPPATQSDVPVATPPQTDRLPPLTGKP